VDNYYKLKTVKDSKFKVAFFALYNMQYAYLYMQRFISFNSIYIQGLNTI